MTARLIHGTLWFKALAIALTFAGIAERWAALIVLPIVACQIAVTIRRGLREQFIEPPEDQAKRQWTNLVWDNAVWVNPETPEQGIERLTTPRRPQPTLHAPHELAIGAH